MSDHMNMMKGGRLMDTNYRIKESRLLQIGREDVPINTPLMALDIQDQDDLSESIYELIIIGPYNNIKYKGEETFTSFLLTKLERNSDNDELVITDIKRIIPGFVTFNNGNTMWIKWDNDELIIHTECTNYCQRTIFYQNLEV
jgi:hypothetical protein